MQKDLSFILPNTTKPRDIKGSQKYHGSEQVIKKQKNPRNNKNLFFKVCVGFVYIPFGFHATEKQHQHKRPACQKKTGIRKRRQKERMSVLIKLCLSIDSNKWKQNSQKQNFGCHWGEQWKSEYSIDHWITKTTW